MKPPISSMRFDHAYSTGVVLAVNALSDAFLLLDAPACAQWRPGFIQGSHDSTSTLWDSEGVHRFQITNTSTDRIIAGNGEDLTRRLARLAHARTVEEEDHDDQPHQHQAADDQGDRERPRPAHRLPRIE